MDLTRLPITYEATIPESYLDAMGHMNVMWYTHLFAKATGGVFRLLGMDRAYFENHRAGSFALAQFFSYLAEVRVGEHVTIRSRMLDRSAKKMHLLHYMSKTESGVLASTGEFLGAHVDMSTRRTSPFPPHIAATLDQIIAEHSALDWTDRLSGSMRV